jgi:hypothetical protein
MRSITFLIFFLTLFTYSIGQTISKADSAALTCRVDPWNKGWNKDWKKDWNKSWKATDYRLPTKLYSNTESNGIIMQNSFPKGGPYTHPNGNKFGYDISWTRVVNETDTPLELTISFPAAILPLPDSYLKLFLLPDTMTLDKVLLYDYGATGLTSFLDTNLNNPTMLRKTINPKEECLFYIGALFNNQNGVVRAGLVLKEQELFYKIIGSAGGLDSALIPCGHIILKK